MWTPAQLSADWQEMDRIQCRGTEDWKETETKAIVKVDDAWGNSPRELNNKK